MKLIDNLLLLVPDGVRDMFKRLRRMENLVGESKHTCYQDYAITVCAIRLCYQTMHSTGWCTKRTSGSKKFSKAQSSCRLFCKGVPVMSRRHLVL